MEEFFDLSKFSSKVPLSKVYHLELDESELLNNVVAYLYKYYMGIYGGFWIRGVLIPPSKPR